MGLISPGAENLLDFLELRQVLSTYVGDLRDPLWWPQERPVPRLVVRGPRDSSPIQPPPIPHPCFICFKHALSEVIFLHLFLVGYLFIAGAFRLSCSLLCPQCLQKSSTWQALSKYSLDEKAMK